MEAKISEIFLSYQGEGSFLGSRQLFVRFYGCNLNCVYCDTLLESYKSFSKEALLGKILDFSDEYNELSLTGGEPLVYAGFLAEFLPLFRKHDRHKVYLETNGVLYEELKRLIKYIDIIAMDFKLPSSTEISKNLWSMHEAFIQIAKDKELIVKTVITDSTTIDDIKRMSGIIKPLKEEFSIILQPVTPGPSFKVPDEEMVLYFREYMRQATEKQVIVLGQTHKYLGIR
ncbi:MAG: 7-carboxy-7-deazaguanine synthase QueE [Candidatus Omnitrophota bacterium]